jgi:hypothetical protein
MFRKKPFIALIATLFLLSLACSGLPGTGRDSGNGDSGDTSAAPTKQSAGEQGNSPSAPTVESGGEQQGEDSGPSGPETVKAGESFKNGWFQLIVLGWTDFKPTDSVKPDSGNKIISVDITAVNLGKDLHQLVDYGFSVKDSEAREFSDNVYLAAASAAYENRNIFPGQRWTGSFGFQVPKDTSGFTLVMSEDSYNKFDRVLIELDSKPGLIEPPAVIEGEKAPAIHPAGEAVPCGEWSIQAHTTKHVTPGDFYIDLLPSGYEILLAELALENTSSANQTLNEMGMFWLQVPSGRRYGEAFLAEAVSRDEVQGSFLGFSTKIAAGEKIRGWIGFGVPENIADPHLAFWCGVSESNESIEMVDIALPE